MLIGSDFYWDFVTGETIRGQGGSVAINTKLGWVHNKTVQQAF